MLFTVYDDKAECYMPVFTMKTMGEALRAFAETANDVNHSFCKYPADFTLFKIGEYDDNTAVITSLPTPVSMGKALEHKTQRELPLGPDSMADRKGSV